MADQDIFGFGVSVSAEVDTASFAIAEKSIDILQDLISTLGAKGVLAGKDLKELTNRAQDVKVSINQASTAAKGAAQSISQMGDAAKKSGSEVESRFDSVTVKAKELSKTLRELAIDHFNAMGTDPLGAAASTLSVGDAQEIIDADAIKNVDALSASYERLNQEREKERALAQEASDWEEAAARLRSVQAKDATDDAQERARQDKSNHDAKVSQYHEQIAEENRLADLKRQQTRDSAVSELKEEQAERERTLASLKSEIQERGRLANLRDQQDASTAQAQLKDEQMERERTLATLKSEIQERARLAQLKAESDAAVAAAQLKEEDAQRARVLTSLKNEIQERTRLQNLKDEQNASTAIAIRADEESARATELAALKQNILARNTEDATGKIDQQSASLPTLRYALYDVAQTAGVVSAAVGAMGASLLAASGSYESSFTAVERTSGVTGDAVGRLQDQFLELSREIPQAFSEITNIGARGAQLGVATDQLEDFTRVVAQFVATSDTVTLEQSVEAFGRISNLLGDTNFEKMGSAITLVGVNAAATEAQIVKTAQELAPFATAVGMSTDEVIGLAAALGSLGQPPERARSAFLTLQRVMDTAIASGTENLGAFADLLGVTADETAKLWKQDPGQFVEAFAASLGGVEDLTTAFADLGINERRAVQVFQALAADARNAGDGVSVLSQAMADSAQGYAEGTEMGRQYALILDDLVSKWQIFQNAVSEFAATAGAALAPTAKLLLDVATSVTHFLTEMTKTNSGKWFIGLAAAIGGVVFIMTSLVATGALLVASLVASKTAMDQLTRTMGIQQLSIKSLRTEFAALAGTVRGGTTALRLFKYALISTGVGAAIALFGTLAEVIGRVGEASDEAFDRYISSTSGLTEAMAADLESFNAAVASGNEAALDSFTRFTPALEEAVASQDKNTEAMRQAAEFLGVMAPAIDEVSSSIASQDAVLGANTVAWLENALVQSEAFQKLMGDSDFVESWRRMGIDLNTVLHIAAQDGAQGVNNYFRALADSSEAGSQMYLSGLALFGKRVGATLAIIARTIATSFTNLGGAIKSFVTGDFKSAASLASQAAAPMASLTLGVASIWTGNHLRKGYTEIGKMASGLTNLGRTTKNLAQVTPEAEEGVKGLGDAMGGAGDSAGKAAREIRTVLDYANDLSGVWDRAFDLRFGGENASDATENILQKLRDDAAAARERIRDLRDEIQGLNADLGVVNADISKTQYFLSVAIEYGDTARAEQLQAQLTKLEADRVKTTGDLEKAQSGLMKEQEGLNKSTQGNTESARDNRQTLQELFKSYQDQLKVYAESGASQEELRKRSQELRDEFVRQGTQLGYTRSDLKKYEDAFGDITRTIAQVPRNVTVEIKGLDAASAALKEFFSKAASDAASAGPGIGGALGGGIGDGVTDSLPELNSAAEGLAFATGTNFVRWFGPLADPAAELRRRIASGEPLTLAASQDLAEALGDKSNEGIANTADPTGEIRKALRAGEPLTFEQSKRLGDALGITVNDGTWSNVRTRLPKSITDAVSGARRSANSAARTTGSQIGQNTNTSTSSALNLGGRIASSILLGRNIASINASSMGSVIATALKRSLSTTLDIIVPSGTARSLIKGITGFSDGGYTGRGGKYDPAGVVHRGEFVVPKHMVNQNTGLPYADAYARLAGLTQAPSRGYANGGHVQGTFPSSVALTPATIQAIASAVQPHLYLNNKEVGESASQAYTRESNIGAY